MGPYAAASFVASWAFAASLGETAAYLAAFAPIVALAAVASLPISALGYP